MRPSPASSKDRSDELNSIAQTVRGTFQTVESMTQSFIREAILRGVYEPGERLNQDDIAERLGISRMPVRGSLRQLEGEGLVRIEPHKGATVSVLRRAEIAEIYDMRVLLECYLLRHAIENLTDESLARLEMLAHDVDHGHAADRPDHLEDRKAFYKTLYDLAERPRVQAAAEQLRVAVGRYLLLIRVDDARRHDSLISSLRARDSAAAERWLADHLNRVSERLQAVFSEDGALRRGPAGVIPG